MSKTVPLTMNWDKSEKTALEAAAFANSVFGKHPPYISHGEIQTGLSDDGVHWVPDLELRFREDFLDFGEDRELLVARLPSGQIVGIAIVAWEETSRRKFAVLEDMAVDPALRSDGIGELLLDAIDQAVKSRGIDWLFLESGRDNVRAHGFFARHGFAEMSHVFGKKLAK
jgi:ribosomal protein S18 acetylase RimI-like enzyme